jgi:indole-3-glycerol phosphate synthase
MNILDQIIENKRKEVAQRKSVTTVSMLSASNLFNRNTISLVSRLLDSTSTGIIAEFKRRSPSKGVINNTATHLEVAVGYENAGAAGISILTDEQFFGGADTDLINVRSIINIPILRKEFIIDDYQLYEAKSIGADVILLIAACLTPDEVISLSSTAQSLGLEVLLELHDEDELGHICDTVDMVGINNRSLKTFDVDIERSLKMAQQIPARKLKIAESGIDDPTLIKLFRSNGYSGFLIGENFMKSSDPVLAIQQFINLI